MFSPKIDVDLDLGFGLSPEEDDNMVMNMFFDQEEEEEEDEEEATSSGNWGSGLVDTMLEFDPSSLTLTTPTGGGGFNLEDMPLVLASDHDSIDFNTIFEKEEEEVVVCHHSSVMMHIDSGE